MRILSNVEGLNSLILGVDLRWWNWRWIKNKGNCQILFGEKFGMRGNFAEGECVNCQTWVAAAFLVPEDDFRHEVSTIANYSELFENGSCEDILDYAVQPLAKKYSVSLDVILRKLADNKYISSEKSYALYKIHKPDVYQDNDRLLPHS